VTDFHPTSPAFQPQPPTLLQPTPQPVLRPFSKVARHATLATVLAAAAISPALAQKVRLATSAGDIVVELDKAKAPKTVDNFVQYVKAGQYDGTIFHRVIENFMIQGGGMTPDMKEKPTRAPIPLESRNGLSNVRGSIAMARTMVPASATAQFFINVKDNLNLDQPNARDGEGYAVFGKVVSGMDVVDKIKTVATGDKGPHQNVPLQPILIKKASIED
jgi:peptidyl-prolyl cis-trans isomerase A (cyclophilin A)